MGTSELHQRKSQPVSAASPTNGNHATDASQQPQRKLSSGKKLADRIRRPPSMTEMHRQTSPRARHQHEVRSAGRLEHIVTWKSLGFLFLVVALTGFSLNVAVEVTRFSLSDFDTILMISFALVFVIVSVPLTYGLVGWWQHGRNQVDADWKTLQPFRGGLHFVLLQASAWTIYGVVLILIAWVALTGAKNIAGGVIATIGVGGLISQVLVLISLQFFVSATHPSTQGLSRQLSGDRLKAGDADAQLIDETVEELLRRKRENQPLLSAIDNDALNEREAREPLSAPTIVRKPDRHTGSRPHSTDILALAATKHAQLLKQARQPAKAVKPVARKQLIYQIGLLPIALSILSAALAVVVESLELSQGAQVSIQSVALTGLLLTVPLTHLLVAIKHRHEDHSDSELAGYQLFQPSLGGKRFISLQAVGWALWAAALLAAIFSIYVNSSTHTPFEIHGLFSLSGGAGVVSQLAILLSLRYFDSSVSSQISHANAADYASQKHVHQDVPTDAIAQTIQERADVDKLEATAISEALLSESARLHTGSAVGRFSFKQLGRSLTHLRTLDLYDALVDIRAQLIVTSFFLAPLLSLCVLMSPGAAAFTLHQHGVPLPYCLLPSIFLILAYGSTYRGKPQLNGSKEWPAFRHNDVIWADFQRYFNARVIAAGNLDCHPHNEGGNKQYLFCFAPHGIYPMATVWATRCPEWYQNYDIEVNVAGASVMFLVPVVRELVMWSGGLDVSKRSVETALKNGKNILLIPGGQREMRHSHSSKTNVVLVKRHKGFIKLAIQQGCAIVPIYSFGEHEMMDNIYMPTLQAKTTKFLGYMFPMWPYGRWYSPLPNRTPITIVVGDAIPTEKTESPSDEEITRLHDLFYANVKELFYAHRAAAGYPDLELTYSDK